MRQRCSIIQPLRAILLGMMLACVASAHDTGEAHDGNPPYAAKSSGTRVLTLDTVSIKMLMEESNLGRRDVEVGELILPVEFGAGAAHAHGSLEIFYVVEGVLGHEVNGKMHRLEPGDTGFVKPGDTIKHSVLSDGPVKAVVVWVPGGEADALVEHAGFVEKPIE